MSNTVLQRRIARREARKNDPYYIMADNKKGSRSVDFDKELDSIPVVELNIEEINARMYNIATYNTYLTDSIQGQVT